MSTTNQGQLDEDVTRVKGHVKLIKVGPHGYLMPCTYEALSSQFSDFQPRSTDTWVVGFPRAGTTLTQEMVWMIANNLDFEAAGKVVLRERFPYFEMNMLYPEEKIKQLKSEVASDPRKSELLDKNLYPNHKKLEAMSERRFIKSHLPLSLLPSNLLEVGAKVVFVARNPKDISVSCYYYAKQSSLIGYNCDFHSFWNDFQQNKLIFTPYWSYMKEGWKLKSNPNLLFLFYEEINKDKKGTMNKVSEFLLGKRLTDEETDSLENHLNFDNFCDNRSVNKIEIREAGLPIVGEETLIRKGVVGGWVDEFTPELSEQADKWIEKNLKDTDLRFPNT